MAYCDGQMFSGADGAGPREEILLTPELDLDDTYQLSFDWQTSQVAFSAKSLYDLQVRIVKTVTSPMPRRYSPSRIQKT